MKNFFKNIIDNIKNIFKKSKSYHFLEISLFQDKDKNDKTTSYSREVIIDLLKRYSLSPSKIREYKEHNTFLINKIKYDLEHFSDEYDKDSERKMKTHEFIMYLLDTMHILNEANEFNEFSEYFDSICYTKGINEENREGRLQLLREMSDSKMFYFHKRVIDRYKFFLEKDGNLRDNVVEWFDVFLF